jgi:hypothetical protein
MVALTVDAKGVFIFSVWGGMGRVNGVRKLSVRALVNLSINPFSTLHNANWYGYD